MRYMVKWIYKPLSKTNRYTFNENFNHTGKTEKKNKA